MQHMTYYLDTASFPIPKPPLTTGLTAGLDLYARK